MDISLNSDFAWSLAQFLKPQVYYYPLASPGKTTSLLTVSGVINTHPIANLYRKNDIFIIPGFPNTKGQVTYVAEATPNLNQIRVEVKQAATRTMPHVVVVNDSDTFEVKDRKVHLGIRSRTSGFRRDVVQFEELRTMSKTRRTTYINLPFYSGPGNLHVQGYNREDVQQVFEMVNKPFEFQTGIYKLKARFKPDQPLAESLNIGDLFKSLLRFEYDLSLTESTPFDELPGNVGDDLFFPYEDWLGAYLLSSLMDEKGDDLHVEFVGQFPRAPRPTPVPPTYTPNQPPGPDMVYSVNFENPRRADVRRLTLTGNLTLTTSDFYEQFFTPTDSGFIVTVEDDFNIYNTSDTHTFIVNDGSNPPVIAQPTQLAIARKGATNMLVTVGG